MDTDHSRPVSTDPATPPPSSEPRVGQLGLDGATSGAPSLPAISDAALVGAALDASLAVVPSETASVGLTSDATLGESLSSSPLSLPSPFTMTLKRRRNSSVEPAKRQPPAKLQISQSSDDGHAGPHSPAPSYPDADIDFVDLTVGHWVIEDLSEEEPTECEQTAPDEVHEAPEPSPLSDASENQLYEDRLSRDQLSRERLPRQQSSQHRPSRPRIAQHRVSQHLFAQHRASQHRSSQRSSLAHNRLPLSGPSRLRFSQHQPPQSPSSEVLLPKNQSLPPLTLSPPMFEGAGLASQQSPGRPESNGSQDSSVEGPQSSIDHQRIDQRPGPHHDPTSEPPPPPEHLDQSAHGSSNHDHDGPLFEHSSTDEPLDCFAEPPSIIEPDHPVAEASPIELDDPFADTPSTAEPGDPFAQHSSATEPNNPSAEPSPTPGHHDSPAVPGPSTEGQSAPAGPVLNAEQRQVVDAIVIGGKNVFYTGSAGCGKSTVLQSVVRELKAHAEKSGVGAVIKIVAPTHRASFQVNGTTLASFMGWGPGTSMTTKDLLQKAKRKNIRQQIRKTDVLIIDEISMIGGWQLDRVNLVWKSARQCNKPFGGVQLVVTGDFAQLPPVSPFSHCHNCGLPTQESQRSNSQPQCVQSSCPQSKKRIVPAEKWAFNSAAWREAKFEYFNLRTIHRQSDEPFINLLRKCRSGEPLSIADRCLLKNHPDVLESDESATKLFCTNAEVTAENSRRFEALGGQSFTYRSLDHWMHGSADGEAELKEKDKDGSLKALRGHRLEPTLKLKVGMLVILQATIDAQRGMCSGSHGRILSFAPFKASRLPTAYRQQDLGTGGPDQQTGAPLRTLLRGEHAELQEKQIRKFKDHQSRANLPDDPEVRFFPVVHFLDAKRPDGRPWRPRVIFPTCMVHSYGEEQPFTLLHRTQIPLVPGWAMSVHKSQGLTLDRVIVNLSRVFEQGQGYVALSRARSLSRLRVEGNLSEMSKIGADEDVRAFLEAKFGKYTW